MRYFTVMTNLARCNELNELGQNGLSAPAYGTNLLGIPERCFKWYVKSFGNNLNVADDKWNMKWLVIDSVKNEGCWWKIFKIKRTINMLWQWVINLWFALFIICKFIYLLFIIMFIIYYYYYSFIVFLNFKCLRASLINSFGVIKR